MSERSDRELVEQAQRGDGAAIGELFSRYWRAARAAAFGVTGEIASAEDAASEAFTQALAGMESLRDPERFASWLRTIVIRKARLSLSSGRRTIDDVAENLSDLNERQDEALARLELSMLLRKAMQELPDPLREAMALIYVEGYDAAVAARFLDIPHGTLRRRLHDGRVRLRTAILQAKKPMNGQRERALQRLRTMIDSGEIYQVLREGLAMRPPAKDIIGTLFQAQSSPVSVVKGMLRPSARVSDPDHPVGSVFVAIRRALPDFQEWTFDVPRDGLRPPLPPGFAEGKPGAFLRTTRAIVHRGSAQSMYELMQDSDDEQTFRVGLGESLLSDVVDLSWMVEGAIELRSVQALLERLTSAVLAGAFIRFSSYDEPRYRSALQLHVGNVSARAAFGGVLSGIEAAHVRIFLEPWAMVHSGGVIEFEPLTCP